LKIREIMKRRRVQKYGEDEEAKHREELQEKRSK
jgi:hypothetical protein